MLRKLICFLAADAIVASVLSYQAIAQGALNLKYGASTPPSSVRETPSRATRASLQDEFLSIERDVPGFAGAYISSVTGEVVVRHARIVQRQRAEARVRALMAAHGRPIVRLRFDAATYRVSELVRTSSIAMTAWQTEAPSIRYVAISFERNKVVVGVVNLRVVASLRRRLRSTQISDDAIEFETADAIEDTSTLADDNTRPVLAGTIVWNKLSENGGPEGGCTLGFNARSSQVNGEFYVGPSHCSITKFHLDSLDWKYKCYANHFCDKIAFEYLDPPKFTCPDSAQTDSGYALIGSTRNDTLSGGNAGCRYSDAALNMYQTDIAIGAFGWMALPSSYDDSTASYGMARITADQIQHPLEGDSLEFVGMRSGRKKGVVRLAIANGFSTSSGHWLLLQSVLSVSGQHGDSGSPVFRANADGTVTLAGMMWGPTVFSPFANIDAELGGLEVTDRYAGDHGTMSATAILPYEAPLPNQQSGFTPVFQGGQAPFSCAWSVDGSSVGSSNCTLAYTNSGSPFFLAVTVTDAIGSHASTGREITPYDQCYPYDCISTNTRRDDRHLESVPAARNQELKWLEGHPILERVIRGLP